MTDLLLSIEALRIEAVARVGAAVPRPLVDGISLSLDRGEVLAIFPEGQLTRTGLLGPFFRGLEVILEGRARVPVIPVYIDTLWGSLFSFSGRRFFRKRPEGWRRQVNVAFGPTKRNAPKTLLLRHNGLVLPESR